MGDDLHVDIDALIEESRQKPGTVDASAEDPQNEKWRPISERFGSDFEGAYGAATELADDINWNRRQQAAIQSPYKLRAERRRSLAARLLEQADKLDERAEEATKRLRASEAWRMERMDEFRRDYAAQLHLKGSKRVEFPGGTFTFRDNATRRDFAKAEDGTRDDAAIAAWVGGLYDLGLFEVWDELNPAERSLNVDKLKKHLVLDDSGDPLFEKIIPAPIPDALQARIDDPNDPADATAEKVGEGGEVETWLVRIPAVYVEKASDGTPMKETRLFRAYTPEDRGEAPYTLEFKPTEEVS